MHRANVLFSLAALAAAALAGCGREPARPVRIVLITLDTLRADGLDAMPATAALAGRGARFEQAFSATSTTQPTHASLLTGLHPWQHGVTDNGQVLDARFETLAERLSARGFCTAAVVASFPLERRFGTAQGFDAYQDEFQVPYARHWEGEELEDERFYSLAASVTDRALAQLDRAAGERQFFWFHYFDPHDPYGDAPAAPAGDGPARNDALSIAELLAAAGRGGDGARELARTAHELYRRDLAALDRALARLFERLDRDRERFETHVLLTADHGESFGERGCLGHGKRLVPEQVRVPLVIVSPRVASGVRSDAAGSVDVAATILALAGLDPGAGPGRDLAREGRGFVAGMRRGFDEPRDERLIDGRVVPVGGPRFFAVREGRLFAGDGTQVFEDDDPARPVDPALASELRSAFAGFAARLSGASAVALDDEEVRRALDALGYARHGE